MNATKTNQANILTGDRYVVTQIHNGTINVLQGSGHCIPCKWHAKNQRLESVAINKSAATNVPGLYNLSNQKRAEVLSRGWMLLTLGQAEELAAHI